MHLKRTALPITGVCLSLLMGCEPTHIKNGFESEAEMAQLNGMGYERFEHFQNRGGFGSPERAREALSLGYMTNSDYNGNLVQEVTDIGTSTFYQQGTSAQKDEPLNEVLALISDIDDPDMRDIAISSYRMIRQQKVSQGARWSAEGTIYPNLTEAFCEDDTRLKTELTDKSLVEKEGILCTEARIAELHGKEERQAAAREQIAKALEAEKQKKAAEAEALKNSLHNPQWRQVEDIPKEWAQLSGQGEGKCDFGGSEKFSSFTLRDPYTAAEYMFTFSRLKAEWTGERQDRLKFDLLTVKQSAVWVSGKNPNLFMLYSEGLSMPVIYLLEDGRALGQHLALDGKSYDPFSEENFGQKFLPSDYSRWSVDTSETESYGDEKIGKYGFCEPSSYAHWLDATWTDKKTGKRYKLRQLLSDLEQFLKQ